MNQTETTSVEDLACVILAAGQGTRMKSARPKIMHEIAGAPMIRHVVAACEKAGAKKIVAIIGPDMEEVRRAVAPYPCAVQQKPLGTGDAAKAARGVLDSFTGDVLVLFGDAPLLTPVALRKLIRAKNDKGAAVAVMGFRPDRPDGYGRIVDYDGFVDSIIEEKEATPEQLEISLCNGGIMLFESALLWPLLEALDNRNAKGEYYLTDCVALARAKGRKVALSLCENEEVRGVNDKKELAEAEKAMQKRLREEAMKSGVTMTDPDTVHLCADTKLGHDVTIGPNVFFGPGVIVGDAVEIRSFSHIEGATIEAGAVIGPFARVRPGAHIGAAAHIGNFVEIKKADIGEGAKINHLSYVGDASVGAKTNIGAGTITCNYDGHDKYRTDIGANVFIGSNAALVAPISIGDGALIAAGSTITKNVPDDALAAARGKQETIAGGAARFRARKRPSKRP